MKKNLLVICLLIILNAFAQEKQIWAKSVLNQKAPKIIVEKWLSDKPNTKGKFVLIDFWATWCGPCKKAIPELNQFSKEFENDLVVIGVSDETAEKVASLTEPKMNYFSGVDPQRRMYNTLEVKGIPHCILVDPEGIVRWEGFPILKGFELTSETIKTIITEYKNTKS